MTNTFRFLYYIIAFCFITHSHAQSTIGPAGSQQGGFEDYEINCPADEFLVGMVLRTGWYVDNIGIVCASFDAAGNTIIETLDTNNDGLFNDVDDEKVTGGGDITTTLNCPNNSVINQLGGREEAYLDALGARCTNTNNTASTGLNITGGPGGSDFNLFCPSGQVVTGISGRAGWWIDSANFICEPLCLSTPAQVNLLSPQNGESLPSNQSVSFSWSVPGAGFIIGQQFQMCISSDAANGCDIFQAVTSQTSIEVAASSISFNNNPLFWSVRAINNCGEAGPFTQANLLNPPGQGTGVVGPGIDYRPLCSVYKDERCSACHGGPAPANHPVAFPAFDDALARFNDDSCTTCHSVVHPDNNQNVWEFPPGAADEVIGVDLQTFADPATCGDICRSVRNWAEQHDFIHHIEVDPLVRYGFEPEIIQGTAAGTLSVRPPVEAMTHGEYINLSTSWYRNGMPCDPINNDFPNGTVSAAGNSNDDSGDNGNNADDFDPRVLDKVVNVPPVTDLLWWIDGSKEKLKSNKPTNTGKLPSECLELIKQPGRPIPIRSLQSRLRDQNIEILKKECKRIMAAHR